MATKDGYEGLRLIFVATMVIWLILTAEFFPTPDPRMRDLPVGYRIQPNGIWKYDGSSRIHRGVYDLEGSY